MTSQVRVRFAPSPTGYLHIGGLRTALYNYLYARQQGGKFILRIEDTDQSRFVEGAMENLVENLEWAGIEIDEGVTLKDGQITQVGDRGPYIQSQRLDIYKKYVDQLLDSGHAYYCFCSKDRLDKLREEQKIKGQVPRYDGLCRNIPREEAEKRIAAGEDYVIRLKLPIDEDITFHDEVRGDITINSNESDDQVLVKSDGFPTYHLAVVVDDHLMGVTHIVRGEEWLSSTPKHLILYRALGWDIPTYVHLPGVLNEDHKKLSKRQGDVSVEDFRGHGYLAKGLVNYLALVGWSPDSNQEIFDMDSLIEAFSFDRVAKTGGVFDKKKLDWVNAHHIKDLSLEDLAQLSLPYMEEAGLLKEEEAKAHWDKYLVLMKTIQDGLSRLEEIPGQVAFLFEEPSLDKEAKEVLENPCLPQIIEALRKVLEPMEELSLEEAGGLMKKVQKESGCKGKNLYMPARVALTGQVHGPELSNILYLLGKDKILSRLDQVEENLK
ncbi:MAG: glutamate--tRNA ligase [Tissierellia bacterium]|nr:glutamate--tRNA ligase [Tissierellia bacterium]